MIDFIPLEYYTPIFNYLILILVLFAAVQGFSGSLLDKGTLNLQFFFGVLLTVILIFYIGLRPISGRYFGDTANYASLFERLSLGVEANSERQQSEWVFSGMMRWFAQYTNVHVFYLFCSLLYFGLNWLATRKLFGEYFYIPLLVIMSMFGFFSNAVNGIRIGLALSALLLAFGYRHNKVILALLCFYAYFTHNSSILVIASGVVAWFVKNPKFYIRVWVLSILLSLTVGGMVTNLMLSLGISDDRFEGYLTSADQYAEQFSRTGFRWDFLLYSAFPIVVGGYFIFKRKFADQTYLWMYNIYILSNSFWILVINAAFSNRFAMISWSIMPLILIYPFYKQQFWSNQSAKIGTALLAFYAFTFLYNIVLR